MVKESITHTYRYIYIPLYLVGCQIYEMILAQKFSDSAGLAPTQPVRLPSSFPRGWPQIHPLGISSMAGKRPVDFHDFPRELNPHG